VTFDTAADLLELVHRALDEIDDRPVSVTARRTARIASMLGDSIIAVWLGLELKPSRGHPPANAEDTRRLMLDPSSWGDASGPAEQALTIYMTNRRVSDGDQAGKIDAHSLSEIETWQDRIRREFASDPTWLPAELRYAAVIERVRHSCFASLCSWERQLSYANVNERIFERFRSGVDSALAAAAPEVLDQFGAVYRRLRDAARDRAAPVGEELAQATATCRRILKAVIDHLLPGVRGAATEQGHKLDDQAYRNRVYEWIKRNVASESTEEAIRSAVGGLYERFEAMDRIASKGVHASVGLAEAELCAIHTYLLVGELLRACDEK
jgi:hypothetical protein